jgi:hypothetical protein
MLVSNLFVPSMNVKGPFSVKAPINEEHPGPPYNQSMTGLSYGSWIAG